MSENISELKTELRDAQNTIRTTTAALAQAKRHRLRLSIWSAAGGFLLFAIGGHWFPGYQLDSTAIRTSNDGAANAVSKVMAGLCAERFMMTPGFEPRLAGLKNANGDWSKAKYIREGGWSQTPDGETSDYATAERCVALIDERLSGTSEKTL